MKEALDTPMFEVFLLHTCRTKINLFFLHFF